MNSVEGKTAGKPARNFTGHRVESARLLQPEHGCRFVLWLAAARWIPFHFHP
jgi:hypothetical protein